MFIVTNRTTGESLKYECRSLAYLVARNWQLDEPGHLIEVYQP